MSSFAEAPVSNTVLWHPNASATLAKSQMQTFAAKNIDGLEFSLRAGP
jgi:hypothetical protein